MSSAGNGVEKASCQTHQSKQFRKYNSEVQERSYYLEDDLIRFKSTDFSSSSGFKEFL